MPWYTDQNGFQYYVDETTGNIVTPVSNEPPPPPQVAVSAPSSPQQAIRQATTNSVPQNSSPSTNPLISSQSGQPVTTGYTYDEWGNPIPITYTPPEVAATQPSNTEVYTEQPGQGPTIPIAAYNPAAQPNYVPTPEMYQSQLDTFNSKWEPLIKDNTFIGTKDQFNQYNQEVTLLEKQYKYLSAQESKQRVDLINWENDLKASNPDLYALYKYNPDKFKEEVIKRNAQAVLSQQQYNEWQQAISKLSSYKNEQGQYNLVQYLQDHPIVKDGVVDETLPEYQLLRTAGFSVGDIATANYYAQGGGTYSIGPSNAQRPNFFEAKQIQLNAWSEQLKKDHLAGVDGTLDPNVQRAIDGAAGVLVGALTIFPGVVTSLGTAITRPEKIPSMAKQMADGVVWSLKALNPMTGASSFDIGTATFNIGMMADIATGSIKKIITWVDPSGIPASLLGKEISTGRIKNFIDTPEGQIQLGNAMRDALSKAMEKSNDYPSGKIPIGDTGLTLRFLKTPIEQTIGNIVFHGTNEGLESLGNSLATKGVGESGLYTDPWAAIGYTRNGTSPGIVMVLTDSSKIKGWDDNILANVSTSDRPYVQASEGVYGPAKLWKNAWETELVYAPGSKFTVPDPTASLSTRILSGGYSDFYTYDSGKFVPIKVAIDQSIISSGKLPSIPSPVDLYAVKLHALENTLVNVTEMIKHPELALVDVMRTIKAGLNVKDIAESDIRASSRLAPPGVRDIYIEGSPALRLKLFAEELGSVLPEELVNTLKKIHEDQTGSLKLDATEAEKIALDSVEREYGIRAANLLRDYATAVNAYNSDPTVRDNFEKLYLTNLGNSFNTLIDTSELVNSSITEIGRVTSAESVPDVAVSSLNPQSENITPSSSVIGSSSIDNTSISSNSISSTKSNPVSDITSPNSESSVISDINNRGSSPPSENISSPPVERKESSPSVVSPPSSEIVTPPSSEIITPPSKVITPPTRSTFTPPDKYYPVGNPPVTEITVESDKGNKKNPDEHPPITWKQGFVFRSILWNPETERYDIVKVSKTPMPGATIVSGIGSAYATIQALGGNADVFLTMDMGIEDVVIDKPARTAGKAGAIRFKRDRYQMTDSDLTAKGVKLS